MKTKTKLLDAIKTLNLNLEQRNNLIESINDYYEEKEQSKILYLTSTSNGSKLSFKDINFDKYFVSANKYKMPVKYKEFFTSMNRCVYHVPPMMSGYPTYYRYGAVYIEHTDNKNSNINQIQIFAQSGSSNYTLTLTIDFYE